MQNCMYRGRALRTEKCPTCRGSVAVKIFACSKHKICSIQKQVYQIITGRYGVCESCTDRRESLWVHVELADNATQSENVFAFNSLVSVDYVMGIDTWEGPPHANDENRAASPIANSSDVHTDTPASAIGPQ